MSRSTESETVPYKATVWNGITCWLEREKAPEFLIRQRDHEESLDEDILPRHWTRNGWTGTWGLQQYGCVYVTTFKKDAKTVYFVNENEYANGGTITATYFADKKAHLAAFLKDNFPGVAAPIQAKRTIQQTL